MSDNKHHQVNESADKIVLKTKIKRGTGTRDQDEINIKVKDNTPVGAATKLHNTIEQLDERDTVDVLREAQPREEGDE